MLPVCYQSWVMSGAGWHMMIFYGPSQDGTSAADACAFTKFPGRDLRQREQRKK
jgi:hypothetical protein